MIHHFLILAIVTSNLSTFALPQLPRGGRVLVVSGDPRHRSPSGQAGFRLPLASQDAVVVEAEEGQVDSRSHGDIPRDRSGKGRAGFRLPLPEIEDDFVVVESAVGEARSGGDIPRDGSGSGRAGFRLPLPEEEDLLAGCRGGRRGGRRGSLKP